MYYTPPLSNKLYDRMTTTELQNYIDSITFPILTSWDNPSQLYLYKDWDVYVESYDPVYEIKIDGDKLKIEWFGHKEYEHNISDFDYIKVEPYIALLWRISL